MIAEWDEKQRAAASADLCERAARMLREEPLTRHGRTIARVAAQLNSAAHARVEYVYCLRLAGVNDSDRAVAATAISAGKHPPDSLPGRAMAYGAPRCEGETHAINAVLEWIGAKL